jgi:hypothetical protein
VEFATLKKQNAMYCKRITHVITVLFVLLFAMACPLAQGLCAGLLDEDPVCCIRKRYSKSECRLQVLGFLQKLFSGKISRSCCWAGPLFLAATNTYTALSLTALSATILLL